MGKHSALTNRQMGNGKTQHSADVNNFWGLLKL